ncbi:MAG TPA: O-antigen ligase family protein, partial [Bryobacteraceae bacterium]|nr:O-antigen ligase family protein [Bryobacteraceae bacterium]
MSAAAVPAGKRPRTEVAIPAALGIWSAAIALAPGVWVKLALVAPAVIAGAVWWMLLRPHRWLAVFFIFLLLTPPLPIPLGDSGVHTAPLLAVVGLLAGVIRMKEWRTTMSPIAQALLWFIGALLLSLPFAAFYSGLALAARSLLRVGLFSIGAYVFLWALNGPRQWGANSLRFTRFLFVLAVLAALFACADFYFQFPAPAGYEQQFVWLDEGVLRRAQGLFYEASTLGNFCAFFLVMCIVAVLRPRAEIPCPRLFLGIAGLIFATALIFSYSRASIVAVLVACFTLAALRRARIGRALANSAAALLIAAALVQYFAPSFAASYWARIVTSFQNALVTPNGVLTGRLATWSALATFLANHPWHAIFGTGFKTLPYSNFVGTELVADNTYLSLLVETGVIGLAAFLFLN